MNRRQSRRYFLLGAGALLAGPLVGAGRQRRVAWVLTLSPIAELAGAEPTHPITRAFVRELRALGYVEGENLAFERRSAEGDPTRFAGILAELLKLDAEVIVLPGHGELNRLAKQMTKSVPIVVFAMNQPAESGLVDSLARPGGNITGLTVNSGPENEAKRLQLLKEAIPGVARVAYLGTGEAWDNPIGRAVRQAAASMGVALVHALHAPGDLQGTFAALSSRRPQALFASLSAETYGQRRQIAEFATSARLPGIFPYLEMASMGGLMAYGVDVVDLGRRAAHYVDKILKGARPGDLAIERPSKFALVVNLAVARRLGIAISRPLLLRADTVIE